MIVRQAGSNLLLYEPDFKDLQMEAMTQLAQIQAQSLDDDSAAAVASLFPVWSVGTAYTVGTRITDGRGNLYRVVQAHISQADWPIDGTPSLYTPLGVTAGGPDAVPDWRQPTGAQDAYQKGDKVKWDGKVWVSLIDGNVWSPDAYPAGWTEAK